ncbi:MAG: signal peptidase II [Deltaproteobacteria bacterium GWA2_38_16]|nr:MAG: signal peptidase II [Deltaproteobacteria bacterium GWA2_38_16]OGQ01725.1 MAG: signal peptidase II [Deltaproteobacteria bacterium RIFCSPHIGHO2_02_FULL_38_15]OGQ34817.1 MAG: signal peptidase II [Deltaproteobacteria bacterium RIFCSPLOWO2_01_FULL_38_9]HBQ21473.1 signal peptidase II [Deltaproteobacteria bacterium]
MKSKYIILVCLAGLVIALDQISKLYIEHHFNLHESITVIPNFFNLTYIRNTGAAFGLLSRAPESFRIPFFIIIPLIALTIIVLIFKKTKETQVLMISSLSLILGGAIGNFIDRVRFNYVIDFLDFHWFNYHWPAFNVADMTIVVGVILLIFYTLEHDRKST